MESSRHQYSARWSRKGHRIQCSNIILYSGNRFCYVKLLHKAIPRYVIYNMPDPMQMNYPNTGLIDLKIVVYHEGQDINCNSCLADDHQVQECPERQNKRRDSSAVIAAMKLAT